MSDLQAITNAVYEITNRPDLVGLTLQAIQKATIKEHTIYDFNRDLVVSPPITITTFETPSGTNRYSISRNIGSLIRIRKIFGVTEQVPGVAAIQSFIGHFGQIVFKEVSERNIFDEYSTERQNYYTRLGETIQVVASRPVSSILIRYYQLPDTSATTYQSWIADSYPYVIADHAAIEVFRAIGKKDEEKIYMAKLGDNRTDVLRSEVTEVD